MWFILIDEDRNLYKTDKLSDIHKECIQSGQLVCIHLDNYKLFSSELKEITAPNLDLIQIQDVNF